MPLTAPSQKPKTVKKEPGKVAMAFGYLIVLVIVVGVIVGVVSLFSGHKTAAKPKSVAKTQTTKTVSQPTTGQEVSAWSSKYSSVFTSLSNDMGKVSTDSSNADLTALHDDCQQLQTDVSTAQGNPPIPDNNAEQHWSSALTHLGSGAQDCIQGTANADANQITQAASEFSQGTSELNATTSAIKQLN